MLLLHFSTVVTLELSPDEAIVFGQLEEADERQREGDVEELIISPSVQVVVVFNTDEGSKSGEFCGIGTSGEVGAVS